MPKGSPRRRRSRAATVRPRRAADRPKPRPAPPVEQEGHRTGGRIGAVELIGGVGDIGLRLALVVEQADRTGGRREGERASRERQRLFGGGIRRQAMLL